MSKIIIGIDPDSKAHGVAAYVDGKLTGLECLTIIELMNMIPQWKEAFESVDVHIENVCGMSAVFRQRQKANQAINMKMANSVGRCQQSQIELERIFNSHLIFPTKHKISKMWKKDKAQFEKVTGWTGRSNEDTRSAAWMGYQGLNK